jgi:hypothetical protein
VTISTSTLANIFDTAPPTTVTVLTAFFTLVQLAVLEYLILVTSPVSSNDPAAAARAVSAAQKATMPRRR